jgi:lipopolysaccharide biosynthesis protein
LKDPKDLDLTKHTTSNRVKLIAFYLPQFHPIPENDLWWGKGFTEWTNVAKARPLFRGHHQPQLPADLGFYDLRLSDTRVEQAKLAAEHGVGGFCYYHYWFNGKLLLERPIDEVVREGEPSFPFCICWANETWSRRWDGQENEVLMDQDLDAYDPVAHMQYLARIFADDRYIRVNGRPLFLVYRVDKFKDVRETIRQWRSTAKSAGLPELYLCVVKSHMHRLDDEQSVDLGFDAVVDFQPNRDNLPAPSFWNRIRCFLPRAANFIGRKYKLEGWFTPLAVAFRHDYRRLAENVMSVPPSKVSRFPCVIPSWDNSARKRWGATVIQNDDAGLFERWLRSAARSVENYPPEEQLVFVNAWNEWAEGCHLEPDTRNGRRFLEATKRVFGT